MQVETINLINEYITLGQLLQAVDLISSGGAAKWFLREVDVLVNDTHEQRRGRKLYANDYVEIPAANLMIYVVTADET